MKGRKRRIYRCEIENAIIPPICRPTVVSLSLSLFIYYYFLFFCGDPKMGYNRDDPYLFKYCPDQIFQRCIPDNEVSSVIKFYHSEACGDHFSSKKNDCKNLTKWILLAHHVQGLICILQNL